MQSMARDTLILRQTRELLAEWVVAKSDMILKVAGSQNMVDIGMKDTGAEKRWTSKKQREECEHGTWTVTRTWKITRTMKSIRLSMDELTAWNSRWKSSWPSENWCVSYRNSWKVKLLSGVFEVEAGGQRPHKQRSSSCENCVTSCWTVASTDQVRHQQRRVCRDDIAWARSPRKPRVRHYCSPRHPWPVGGFARLTPSDQSRLTINDVYHNRAHSLSFSPLVRQNDILWQHTFFCWTMFTPKNKWTVWVSSILPTSGPATIEYVSANNSNIEKFKCFGLPCGATYSTLKNSNVIFILKCPK